MTSVFFPYLKTVRARAFFGVIAACSGACSAAPSGPSALSQVPADRPPPLPAALVWTALPGDAIQTVWVEDSDKGPVERARRGEPVAADSSGLWAFRFQVTQETCAACDCNDTDGAACPRGEVVSKSLKAVRLPRDKEMSIAQVNLSCGNDTFQFGEGNLVLLSLAGPWLTVAKSSSVMACGAAHPMFAEEWVHYNLEQRVLELLRPPTEAEARLSSQAHATLVRMGEGCLSSDEAPARSVLTRFAYDRRGKLMGHYVYGMPSNYVCGTGPDHYTMVTELVDEALPERLRSIAQAPPWLLRYLQTVPGELLGLQALSDHWNKTAYLEAFLANLSNN